MTDKVSININCDNNTVFIDLSSLGKRFPGTVPPEVYKSELIAKLVVSNIRNLMAMSEIDLHKKYLNLLIGNNELECTDESTLNTGVK